MKYWACEGKFQEDYDKLFSELVPMSGKCDTVAGELVRSANRVYYDAYNNGFGNNVSGGLNHIKFIIPKTEKLEAAIEAITPYSTGNAIGYIDETTGKHLDNLMDSVFEYILNNPETLSLKNQHDMLTLNDKNYIEDDDDRYFNNYEEE